MTRQRNDQHGTEFGDWLRRQPILDSKHGYIATNVDFIWCNHKTGDWMLIEEKRFNGGVTFAQKVLLKKLHAAAKHDPKYRGIHLLVFENTSPDDGAIYWDNKQITKQQLFALLTFKQ